MAFGGAVLSEMAPLPLFIWKGACRVPRKDWSIKEKRERLGIASLRREETLDWLRKEDRPRTVVSMHPDSYMGVPSSFFDGWVVYDADTAGMDAHINRKDEE
jgi:hypothetical protein